MHNHPTKWLAIVGIGDEGLAGLSPVARRLLDQARVIVGGTRHLAMLPPDAFPKRIPWSSPIADSIEQLLTHRGQPVCVLASGDPMCYGVGVPLCRRVSLREMTIIPAPSAFSLACARLGWSLQEIETVSLCGRNPALLQAVVYAGARILVLSADRHTPQTVVDLLTRQGHGEIEMTVLEHLGGPRERIVSGTVSHWQAGEFADLHTIALDCPASIQALSRLPGLPDDTYCHDGQLTKREIRAVTLSTLAPLPGQLLWDVGAGCGSIGIEWLRSHPRCRAVAIEAQPARLAMIADNASALGVPHLTLIAGRAPEALVGLPPPDAVFIGGGLTGAGVFETCWQALKPGGRLVANGVSVEGEYRLFELHSRFGGSLHRLSVQRAEPLGRFLGWKALAPVTQWCVTKDLDS